MHPQIMFVTPGLGHHYFCSSMIHVILYIYFSFSCFSEKPEHLFEVFVEIAKPDAKSEGMQWLYKCKERYSVAV